MTSTPATHGLGRLIQSRAKPTRSEAARKGGKLLEGGLCSWCRKGRHTRCFSMKCRCETCNPPISVSQPLKIPGNRPQHGISGDYGQLSGLGDAGFTERLKSNPGAKNG